MMNVTSFNLLKVYFSDSFHHNDDEEMTKVIEAKLQQSNTSSDKEEDDGDGDCRARSGSQQPALSKTAQPSPRAQNSERAPSINENSLYRARVFMAKSVSTNIRVI